MFKVSRRDFERESVPGDGDIPHSSEYSIFLNEEALYSEDKIAM